MSIDRLPFRRIATGLTCRKCGKRIMEDEQAAGDYVDGSYVVEHADPANCGEGEEKA